MALQASAARTTCNRNKPPKLGLRLPTESRRYRRGCSTLEGFPSIEVTDGAYF